MVSVSDREQRRYRADILATLVLESGSEHNYGVLLLAGKWLYQGSFRDAVSLVVSSTVSRLSSLYQSGRSLPGLCELTQRNDTLDHCLVATRDRHDGFAFT